MSTPAAPRLFDIIIIDVLGEYVVLRKYGDVRLRKHIVVVNMCACHFVVCVTRSHVVDVNKCFSFCVEKVSTLSPTRIQCEVRQTSNIAFLEMIPFVSASLSMSLVSIHANAHIE